MPTIRSAVRTKSLPLPRSAMSMVTLRQLIRDVSAGIRVLHTRDGLKLSESQITERARNIVAGLMGNYRIEALDAGPSPLARRRTSIVVDDNQDDDDLDVVASTT